MTQHMTRLLTSPTEAWRAIRDDAERSPAGFLPTLLLMPLLPAMCLYIGTTQVGWRLPGNEDTQYLSVGSGALLGLMCYVGFIAGVVILAFLVRWVLFRTEHRPDRFSSMTFATGLTLPMMVAGMAALMPSRWLLLIAAGLACAYSAMLLFKGLPIFMRLSPRASMFYASCILGVGFLALLTTAFMFIEFWGQTMSGSGEYLQ
ncbi:Inner membrane protein YohC [compost metagenome]